MKDLYVVVVLHPSTEDLLYASVFGPFDTKQAAEAYRLAHNYARRTCVKRLHQP